MRVSEEKFEEIKKKPMQDYIRFGVQSIDWTHIEAYKIEIIEHEDYMEERRYNEPIVVEQGKPPEMDDDNWIRFTEMPYEAISY